MTHDSSFALCVSIGPLHLERTYVCTGTQPVAPAPSETYDTKPSCWCVLGTTISCETSLLLQRLEKVEVVFGEDPGFCPYEKYQWV